MRAIVVGILASMAPALGAAPPPETVSEYSDRIVLQSRRLSQAGRWDAAVAMLDRARAAVAAGSSGPSPSVEASLLAERGRILADRNFFSRQDPEGPRAALEQAGAAARRAGDAKAATDVAQYLGQLDYSAAFSSGNWEKPRATFRETLASRQRSGDRRGAAESLFYVGLTYEQARRPDDAFPLYLESLGISEQIGDVVLQSYALRHIGGIQEERGELDAARRSILRSLALRREARFLSAIPFTLMQLADFEAVHGADAPRAIALLEEALETAAQSGSYRSLALAGQRLAELHLEGGDPQRALAAAECAREAARLFGDASRAAAALERVEAIRARVEAAEKSGFPD